MMQVKYFFSLDLNNECGVCLFKIVTLLEEEFPKLKNLQGGWMFNKSTGIYNLHVKYT